MKSIRMRKKLKLLVFGISFVFSPTNFVFATMNTGRAAAGSRSSRVRAPSALPAACPLASGNLANSPAEKSKAQATALFSGQDNPPNGGRASHSRTIR